MVAKSAAPDDGVDETRLPAWLSPQEAADYIGVGRTWFYVGVMPHVQTKKLGRLTKISRVSLEKYMEALPDQKPRGLRPRHGNSGAGPRRKKKAD